MIDPAQLLEIKSALAYLDSDPREIWLTVGTALHSHIGAERLVEEWC